MNAFTITTEPQATVFVWDELTDGVVPWSVPAKLLGEANLIEAVDYAMASALCPTDPDLLDVEIIDEPLPGVTRAFGWYCEGRRAALYVPASPGQEKAALELAQADYDRHFSSFKD